MIKTTPVQNKALVLQAFDTLFNKRDYKAAERYWSSNYIQHSAHIPIYVRNAQGRMVPIRALAEAKLVQGPQ